MTDPLPLGDAEAVGECDAETLGELVIEGLDDKLGLSLKEGDDDDEPEGEPVMVGDKVTVGE